MGLHVETHTSTREETGNPRIKAFQLPGHGGENPYVDILRASLSDAGFDFDHPYDLGDGARVALLHWTENHWFVGASSARSRIRSSIVRRGLPPFLKTLRARGLKVVWFVHNSTPHDWPGSAEQWFQRAQGFYQHIDAVAHLTNASTRLPAFGRFQDLPHTVVRHPHYDLVDPATHAGRAGSIAKLLMLGGASQPRKNAYAATQAISGIPNIRAVITGNLDSKPASRFMSLPCVDLIDGILSETALFSLYDGSTAVLLNQPKQLNSGCMFLGLSRGAPVICPDTPVNREMRSLVGPEWIRLFEAPLSSDKLAELISHPIPVELPNLSTFSPGLLGRNFRQWVSEELMLPKSEHRSREP